MIAIKLASEIRVIAAFDNELEPPPPPVIVTPSVPPSISIHVNVVPLSSYVYPIDWIAVKLANKLVLLPISFIIGLLFVGAFSSSLIGLSSSVTLLIKWLGRICTQVLFK